MSEKIYLNFLILYGIFSQGIIATFSEDNIKEASHLLIRNKRVLSNKPSEIVPMSINEVPYVVQIQKNKRFYCMGSILLAQVIITAAHCIVEPETNHILSGSAHENIGKRHNIIEYRIHPQYHPLPEIANDLALLFIDPQIDIVHSPNRPIIMHHGRVPSETVGQISSWGCIRIERNGKKISSGELRSIKTSVISQEECHTIQNLQEQQPRIITERDICTYDKVKRNRCGPGDSGAPLVIFNRLAGVMSWTRELGGSDIFTNLSHPVYRDWILDNLPPNTLHPSSSRSIRKKPHNKQPWKP